MSSPGHSGFDHEPTVVSSVNGNDADVSGNTKGDEEKGEKKTGGTLMKYAYEEATAPSRGNLIKDFLSGEKDAEGYMRNTLKEAERFNGFSLVLFEFLQGPEASCFFLNNVDK
jgi:hypothetical protein